MTFRSQTEPSPKASPAGEKITVRRVLGFIAASLWVIVPIAVFYIFHKPFSPGAWERISDALTHLSAAGAGERIRDALVDLSAAGWILWISVGIGRPFFRDREISTPERIAISGALGLGTLALLFLGTAWAGWMTRSAALVLCAGLTLLVSRPMLIGMVDFAKHAPRPPIEKGAFPLGLGFFLAGSLALSLGIALAPPAAWDALVYHFRIPQQILAGGSLSYAGDSLFREMPLSGEMLFTAAMGLTGRGETAAVLGWGTACLVLLGLTGTARRMGLRHTLLPAALLLSGDTLARSMGWGYVDWLSALFGFAALSVFSSREDPTRLVFAGILAGFAAGTKYTAGSLLGVLIFAVLSRKHPKESLRSLTILLAVFSLAFLPWIFRGMAFFGNPLPPILDAGPLAAQRMDFFTGRPLEGAWWMAAVTPLLQSTIGAYGAAPFAVTIGPLLLAFLPGALVARTGEPPAARLLLKLCWLSAIVFWAVCGVGGFFSELLVQPRLYLSLFPGIALLAAYGFEGLWRIRLRVVRLGAAAAVLGALVLAVQLAGFGQSWIASGVPGYLSGSQTRAEYLETNLGWHVRAAESARALPDGSRVLMLWEPRGFYCGQACSEDATIDRWYLLMRSGLTAEEIIAQWREEGWTHVLLFDTGAGFERASRSEYAEADWEELDRLQMELPVVERFGDGYTLYSLE
ncbi:MAG: hypothetical protein JW748_14130 [Anaerolineales bacterium]|nr:hypothetical protein [Anaerolineales bacterium]